MQSPRPELFDAGAGLMNGIMGDMLAALPSPSLAIDGSKRIVAANDEAQKLLGQGITGRHFVTILRQPVLAETIEAVLLDSTARTAHYHAHDGIDETTYKVSVRAVSQARVILLVFLDVTHLEQAGQMRRDFVANVSHELRTPLTALMGFIETLRGPAKNDAAAHDRFLDIMDKEAGRMNRLVGDLLSLSRVEGEQRVRPRDPVALNDIIQSVVRTLGTLAADSGVALELAMPEDKVVIPGDHDQLLQVVTNLAENAIKYGASGKKVVLSLGTVDRDPSLRSAAATIEVKDFGPGIDPVHLPRLTERFYRADSHRSRSLGGTGLGLAIVKHIVNRHRGRLKVTSELGKGASFSVILPSETGSG